MTAENTSPEFQMAYSEPALPVRADGHKHRHSTAKRADWQSNSSSSASHATVLPKPRCKNQLQAVQGSDTIPKQSSACFAAQFNKIL